MLPVLFVRQDEDDRPDLVMDLERLQRPLEDRLALEIDELLPPAEAFPGPRRNDDRRSQAHRLSPLKRPKIILPTVVWRTDVTVISIVWPIIRLELSTTTIVPSAR